MKQLQPEFAVHIDVEALVYEDEEVVIEVMELRIKFIDLEESDE